MADDDTKQDEGVFGDQTSNPFPTAPDPMFARTKKKAKADIKKAVGQADPGDKFEHEQSNATLDPSNEGDVGGKKYKFAEVSANPEGEIKDYSARDDPDNKELSSQLEQVLGGVQNPEDISPHEYAALTKAASKGNKLAQQILVKGKFKTQDYPSLNQDLSKMEDPFVKALSGLPALAENEQTQANKTTQPYDFTNAESQVNNLLGQMGSSQQMTTSPETNTYLGTLQGIVNQGSNNLTQSNLGLPSIMQALGGLGPAAKASEKATPYEGLLASLLSHENYEIETGAAAPPSGSDPAWLQQLIASVIGSTAAGGLPSPSVASGAVGTIPSTGASPTGSNA